MLQALKQLIDMVVVTAIIYLACCQDVEKQLDLTYIKLLNSDVSLEYLVQEYAKVCPYEDTCAHNASTIKVRNFFGFYLACPECSCQPDCVLNDECCPDVIYGYLKYECVPAVQLTENNRLISASYLMISTCPETQNGPHSSAVNVTDGNPVTSLTTGLTYKTKNFANCNADNRSLVMWNTTIFCPDLWFFGVQINTFEDILQYMSNGDCEVRHLITDKNIPAPAPCDGMEYYKTKKNLNPRKLIKTCNETGLWENFDHSIDFACQQLTLLYRYYKNVFCFICNPGLSFKYHNKKSAISTCSLSDEEITTDIEVKDACSRRDETPYYRPFKNLFCKLCNAASLGFSAVNDDLYGTWIHVTNIQADTVAKVIGELFYFSNSSFSDNRSYIDTELNLNMTFDEENYVCSIPLHAKVGSSHCSVRDSDRTGNQICSDHPFYNCTAMFRNVIINRDSNLHVFNMTHNVEEFLYNYVMEMYLCEESITENIFCDATAKNQACTGLNGISPDRCTVDRKAVTCLVCQTAAFYDVPPSGFEILIRINCTNLLEDWLYIDLFSLLEAARDCSITFFPSGIYSATYAKLYLGTSECLDFPFIDQESCTHTEGSFYFGSYRKLFSLPNNDWKTLLYVKRQLPTNVTLCAESVASLKTLPSETCREILCSDGHVLVNGSCVAEYDTYANTLYQITYRFVLSDISGENCEDTVTVNISRICKVVQRMVGSKTGNKTAFSFHACSVHADVECFEDSVVEIATGSNIEIFLKVMIDFTSELTLVEKIFVASLTQSLDYVIADDNVCILKLKPRNGLLGSTTGCRVKSEYVKDSSLVLKTIYINKLLTCTQIELLEGEFTTDNNSDTLIITDGEIRIANYIIRDGRVRVCIDDLSTFLQIPTQVTVLQRMYKLVDNICTILSLLCLFVTFITYCILPSLQTVPGLNNMSITFSLFFAQLTLKLGIWQPANSIQCPLFGILIHYFWLATFCSMNVCSFHMNRVFSSSTIAQSAFTFKTKLQYLLYTYVSPIAIVLLTTGTYLSITNGRSFGYGKTTCFLTDTVAVIVAFICPCVIVFLTNIIFFAKTILYIRRALTNTLVRRSDDRRNFFIYLRLWSLLGVTWPLLIVDAVSDISVFSYITITLNALQGVLIFVSFVCNKRVLNMYRALLFRKSNNQ